MGMLMHRHRVEQMKAEGEAGDAKPKRKRGSRRSRKPVQTHAPEQASEADLADAEPEGVVQEPAEGTSNDPDAKPDTQPDKG